MKKFYNLRKGIFLLFTLMAFSYAAQAANRTWDGGGDGVTWSDAANWTTDTAPTAVDNAIFNSSETVNVTATTTVKILDIRSGITVTLNITGTLNVGAAATSNVVRLDAATLVINSGTLNVTSDLSRDCFQFIGTGGTLNVAAGATVNVSGQEGFTSRSDAIDGTIINSGIINIGSVSGEDAIELNNSSELTLVNNKCAVINLGGANIKTSTSDSVPTTLTNDGLITHTGAGSGIRIRNMVSSLVNNGFYDYLSNADFATGNSGAGRVDNGVELNPAVSINAMTNCVIDLTSATSGMEAYDWAFGGTTIATNTADGSLDLTNAGFPNTAGPHTITVDCFPGATVSIEVTNTCAPPCGASAVNLPPAGTPTTITCVSDCDDGAWTYYENPNTAGEFLFAIEWDAAGTGNNAAAKSGAQVVIDVDATFTTVDDGTEQTWTMARYWNVTPGAALVDPVNIKFFYDAAEKTEIETEMNTDGRPVETFKWFKTVGVDFDPAIHVTGVGVTGAPIELIDMNAGGALENGVLYAQFDGITSFSGGTGATGVGSGNSPLPVELISFTGKERGTANILEWVTASERNNDFFEIQRSTNGRDFETLENVKGNGTVNTISTYRFIDEKPATVCYYRLQQVDFDGKSELSNIVTVKRDLPKDDAKLFPSPVKDVLSINYQSTANKELTMSVVDMTGRVLITKLVDAVEGNNEFNLDLANLPAGTYMTRLNSGTDHISQIIIKL